MKYLSSRQIGLLLAAVLVGALFYSLRVERRAPQLAASAGLGQAERTAGSVRPSHPDTSTKALAEASRSDGNLSPDAAARAPAVPNFVDLVQVVKPAVVSIRVKSDVTPQVTSGDGGQSPFEGTPFERLFPPFGAPSGAEHGTRRHLYAQAQGSGFFIDKDGHVITNNHVVANGIQLQVVTDDGRVLDAKLVGTDPKTDLALLKVDGPASFPFVTLAAKPAKIGEWVIAMGNPFGLGGTVTAGIISAQGRDIGAGPYDDFLQIDAAVNRGNSGGPTFNMSGHVIGVNTAIYSPSGGSVGIAFAIPARTVNAVIAQLKERGYVSRGWIGVQVQPVTKEIADGLGIAESIGALISGIQANSPAAQAGLKVGDVLTAINGSKISTSRDLARQVAAITPKTGVKIDFLRDGKTQTAELTIGQQQDSAAREPARSTPDEGKSQRTSLGISVAPASRVMGIGEEGLAILRVDPAGKGAEAGLTAGDVILQVGGKEVSNPDDLRHAFEEAVAQKKQHALLLVRRNDQQMFVSLPLGPS
jgi:serine protease Do